MKLFTATATLAAGLSAGLALGAPAPSPAAVSAPAPQDADELADTMERMAALTTPGNAHAYLERMVGDWDIETSILMGGQRRPPTQGTATFEWLYDGRWLKHTMQGSMMGQPLESTSLMGYDVFKQSYVVTTVSTMDTAMNRSEGDLDDQQNEDPADDVLILWGTIDEYITGEHDKLVKTVYRFPTADTMVMEIHDMAIGEDNTQVIEVKFTRRD